MIDVILVPGIGPMKGVWLHAKQSLSEKDQIRLIELIAGRERVRADQAYAGNVELALPMRAATPEQWMHLIGLVVVEQAVRLEL